MSVFFHGKEPEAHTEANSILKSRETMLQDMHRVLQMASFLPSLPVFERGER